MKIVSLNIRWPSPQDGANRWEYRAAVAVSFLQAQEADVIALQEVMTEPLRFLTDALRDFDAYGVARDDGVDEGERCTILVRRSIKVAGSGTFWFSDTPEVAGSRTWGNRHSRICTWVRLPGLVLANVHLDHESQPARLRSTELLVQRFSADEPTVIAGDFNVGESDPALAPLRSAGFEDSYRICNPDAPEPSTFHEWGRHVEHPKIDYIWVRGVAVQSAEVLPGSFEGRWISDHHAVFARLRTKPV